MNLSFLGWFTSSESSGRIIAVNDNMSVLTIAGPLNTRLYVLRAFLLARKTLSFPIPRQNLTEVAGIEVGDDFRVHFLGKDGKPKATVNLVPAAQHESLVMSSLLPAETAYPERSWDTVNALLPPSAYGLATFRDGHLVYYKGPWGEIKCSAPPRHQAESTIALLPDRAGLSVYWSETGCVLSRLEEQGRSGYIVHLLPISPLVSVGTQIISVQDIPTEGLQHRYLVLHHTSASDHPAQVSFSDELPPATTLFFDLEIPRQIASHWGLSQISVVVPISAQTGGLLSHAVLFARTQVDNRTYGWFYPTDWEQNVTLVANPVHIHALHNIYQQSRGG